MTGSLVLTFSGVQGATKAGDFRFLIGMTFSGCNMRGAGCARGVGLSLQAAVMIMCQAIRDSGSSLMTKGRLRVTF